MVWVFSVDSRRMKSNRREMKQDDSRLVRTKVWMCEMIDATLTSESPFEVDESEWYGAKRG